MSDKKNIIWFDDHLEDLIKQIDHIKQTYNVIECSNIDDFKKKLSMKNIVGFIMDIHTGEKSFINNQKKKITTTNGTETGIEVWNYFILQNEELKNIPIVFLSIDKDVLTTHSISIKNAHSITKFDANGTSNQNLWAKKLYKWVDNIKDKNN